MLTSYIVAAAIMTPVTGWLSDRLRPQASCSSTAVVGFTISSMLCGLAWSLDSMVAFRLMQGVFGAAIVPLSQTFLLDINPKEKHGSAMAIWGAGIMVGPIIGPTLGGWLTETLQLALGVLHQPAGRHLRLPRLRRLSAVDRAAACAASTSSALPCCRSASARCS